MRRAALIALASLAGLGAWAAGATATPPGLNGDIAFEGLRTGAGDIYTMTAAGANETHIGPPDGTEETDAAWSHDGTRIAFVSSESGQQEIYVMNRDGSGRVRITVNGAADIDPAWSPDGRLAWASDRTGNFELFVAALDGTGLQQLTSHVSPDTDPEWSQGGSAIAFASNRSGNGDIYRLSPTGTEVSVQRLTSDAGTDGHPTWSPDSARVAFDSARGGNTDIYSVAGSGTENDLQRHTSVAQVDREPSWSPDGKRIVFSSVRSGASYDIWTVGATGTESGPLRLTDDAADDVQPAWQTVAPVPVATSLSPPSAFSGSGDLAVIVDGSGFVRRSQVRWNGAPRATQFVSATRLTFVAPAVDLTAPGTARVEVATSQVGGGVSAPLTFTISPPSASPLVLTRASLEPRWVASRLRGRLRLAGTVGRPALLQVRLLRPSGRGKAFVTRRFRVRVAGTFNRRLALVPKLLPGRYLVRVSEVGGGAAPLPPTQRTARLAAPREGVVARAFIGTKIGGRALARITGRPSIIFAHFAFAARPKPGKRLTVSWFQQGIRRPVAVDRKAISRLVIAFVKSSGPLPTGRWRAELRYGGKLVATALVRLV